VVFGLMAGILLISLALLRSIDVGAFQKQANESPSIIERAAMAGDAG